MKRFSAVTFILFMLVLGLGSAWATTVTLTDHNSSLVVDLSSQAGAYAWSVDGVSQLYQQWFWYRVGDVAQQPISNLTLSGYSQPFPAVVTANYAGEGFDLTVRYILLGGSEGSGTADIAEQIRISNTTGSALDFHFYQYSDFDLGGTPYGQSVEIMETPADQALQTNLGGGILSETVITPTATHFEAAFYPYTLVRLNSGVPITLNDVRTAGPGDVTWAFEWDTTIAGHGSFIISKDKHIATTPVPEPASLLLIGGGLLGLAGFRRRFRK